MMSHLNLNGAHVQLDPTVKTCCAGVVPGNRVVTAMTDTADRGDGTPGRCRRGPGLARGERDPDLTVAEWWKRLGESGWAARLADRVVRQGLSRPMPSGSRTPSRRGGALPAPGGLGLLLAGPTIQVHGLEEQKRRYLYDIVTGQKGWCQLLQRARRRVRPGGAQRHDQGRRRDRHRPEGVDVRWPRRRPGHAHRPHRPRRPQARRHHLLRDRHAPAGRRRPAAAR